MMPRPSNLEALIALVACKNGSRPQPWKMSALHSAVALMQEAGYPVDYPFRLGAGPWSDHLARQLDDLELRGWLSFVRHPSKPEEDRIAVHRAPKYGMNRLFREKLHYLKRQEESLLLFSGSYVIHRRCGMSHEEMQAELRRRGQYSRRLDEDGRSLLKRMGILRRSYSFFGMQADAVSVPE